MRKILIGPDFKRCRQLHNELATQHLQKITSDSCHIQFDIHAGVNRASFLPSPTTSSTCGSETSVVSAGALSDASES